MRAWLLDEGSDRYRLGEIDEPPLGPWDVKVRLRASALNHLDLWVARGMPAPPSFPHVPGADGAGIVVEVGQAVEDLGVGAEVLIDPATTCGRCEACLSGATALCPDLAIVGEHRWGTHAEVAVVPGVNLVPKPSSLSWDEAAAFGLVTASAVRMLRRGGASPGTRVMVVGVGGGSATAAFLVAQAFRATVFATSTDDGKRGWALANGAVEAFDSTGRFDEDVRAATGGRGVDLVIDNVGTKTFERSFGALARGGRLVINGSTSGRTAELHLPTLFWRQLEVIGASMHDRGEFAQAVDLAGSGAVRVPVEGVVGFEDYPAALERLKAGAQMGKLVLNR